MVLPLLNTAVLHTRHRNESPMKISYQNGNIGIRTEREEIGLHPVCGTGFVRVTELVLTGLHCRL